MREHLPPEWEVRGEDRLEPVDVRAALAGRLREAGVDATLMRMHPDRAGESNIEKFQRIEAELGIDQHFVYYPYGARGVGHVGEIVALLDRYGQGEGIDLRVFPETNVVDTREGRFHVLEEGRGTGYLHDVIQLRFPVPDWRTHAGLFRAFVWNAG